jgi:hypothetical protein
MRFLDSSSTIHLPSPLTPGLPHPVRSVSRVSHPHDGLLLDRLPGLVPCRSALGVGCPSEPFPRPEPCRLSTTRCPPAVGFRRDAGSAGEGRRGTAQPCPQGTPAPRDGLASLVRPGLRGSSVGARLQGLAPRSESVVAARPIRPKRRPLLSWASRPSCGHARPPPRLDVAADAPGMPDDALRCVPAPHPRPRPALDTGPRPRPKPLS